LPVDSLLGVKYLLSQYEIKGYKQTNIENVYENPYTLPLAFTFNSNTLQLRDFENNPFAYTNAFYSYLMGRRVEIYKPLTEIEKEINDSKNITYRFTYEGDNPIYANLVWTYESKINLDINGINSHSYSCWLSPTVIYLNSKGANDYYLALSAEKDIEFKDEQFYYVDLEVMKNISTYLNERKADYLYENGHLEISCNAMRGDKLFLPIINSDGWQIKLNGKKIRANFDSEFIIIELEEGNNELIMDYQIPGLNLGSCLTIVGLALLLNELRKKSG